MIVKMIKDTGKRMEAQTEMIKEMFNKELENLKTKQTKIKYTISEIKNIQESINSRIMEAEK